MFGVRDGAQLVATAALLPYSAGNAWISMVLVTAKLAPPRPCDQAGRCLPQCRDTGSGLTTWLDATPAGATVYGPLGFTPTLQLRRLRLTKPRRRRGPHARSSAGDLDALDRARCSAMGFDRSTLLAEFAGRPGSRLRVERRRHGARPRRTHRAAYRPAVGRSTPISALALVDAIVRSETGPWLIDAVHSQEEFLHGLVGSGWNIERPFQRMRFGRATGQPAQLPFAVAGPEFG